MRSALFTLLSITGLALAAPAILAPRETNIEATDRLLFSTTMSGFQSARNAQNPPSLDWSSDGCSSSPDNPLGFDFIQSCQRHDFGYRNYKAQSRFSEANKQRIDLNFKADMYIQCQSEWSKRACEGFADVYYAAVHAFGSKRSVEVQEMERRYVEEVTAALASGEVMMARNLGV
ncbi:hypothetical protein DM02DRAFT_599567 [Periconia macrospinosa]|uniref:Uncharacterized protein n=1 Tax=Periconia macrospinosa TaxID=97972 RepID=A0A2V1DDW7_9PLEO|nr:hypothetical protein DM02DRAFT_599567 [Periconia macrospinosa]